MSRAEAEKQLQVLDGWELSSNGKRITKSFQMDDFTEGMRLLNDVAEIAERQDHHPNLHLEDYDHVRIDLSTHAIHGLSENDFILAAKIDGPRAEDA